MQQTTRRTSFGSLLLIASLVVLAACAGPATTGTVVSVTLDQSDFTLGVGATAQLTAEVEVDGAIGTGVVWSSGDVAVATVSTTGLVTAVAEGSTTITVRSAADASRSDVLTVTVVAAGTTTLSDLTADVVLGSRVRLDWQASGATSFDVYAVNEADDALLVAGALGADVRTVTIDLPVSTRMTLRVVARGTIDDVQSSVVLTNVVTSSDDYDPYTAGGRTADAPIVGTLRQVLAQASAGAVIGFAADVVEIDLYGVQFTAPNDAHLILAQDVTISGPAGRVILRGVAGEPYNGGDAFTYRSRVVYVPAATTATLDHVTITGGTFIYLGGGVRNDGTLTIRDSLITGNRAWDQGGGIYNNGGTLALIDTEVSGNTAAVLADEVDATFAIRNNDLFEITLTDGGYGGGMTNNAGTVTTSNTTFSDNQAKYSGGSIYNRATLTMTGSDVRNSSADRTLFGAASDFAVGGGIYTEGPLTLTDAEIEGNDTLWFGGGLIVDRDGSANLTTVHFAGNVADFGGGIRHEYWNATGPGNLQMDGTTYAGNVARDTDPDLSVTGYDVEVTSTARPGRWVEPTGPDAPFIGR